VRTARIVVVPVVLAVLLGAAPSASADKILFTRVDKKGERMWVMRPDGSGAHRLRSLGAHQPDLSPDGRQLVWNGNSGLMTGAISGRRSWVGRLRVVSRVCAGMPRWSPSGRQIAATRALEQGSVENGYLGFSQVCVVRPSRGRARLLRTPVHMTYPSWSPEGRRIVAGGTVSRTEETCTPPPMWPPVCTTTGSTSSGLWVIDVRSGAAREILHSEMSHNAGESRGESIGYPAWSPDGKTIAFHRTTADGTTETTQVWTVRPDGTGQRQLTRLPGGAETPAWSPNGRRLAIGVTPDPARARTDIATIRADGSGLRVLTHGGINIYPDWSR
jgi:Tol biopolymer transport system component